MKTPRNRNGRIPPAALALLLAILALPFVYYLLPDSRIWTDPGFAPPRIELRWEVGSGDEDAPPTVGMVFDDEGRASVGDAPQVLPVETYGPGEIGLFPDPPVQPDVARFILALPHEITLGPNAQRERVSTCTLEGEAQYEGRIVLRDGCLRLQRGGDATPGPVVMGYFAVFRDAENYLTIGAMDGRPEAALRVGEPRAQLSGIGCSKDKPVKAPPALAKLCQAETMIRIGTIRRESICSEDRIADLVKQAVDYRVVSDRLRAENAACIAENGRGAPCPPAAAPLPPPGAQSCRMPEGAAERIERAMRPSA